MSIAVAVRESGRIALATDSQTTLGRERVPPENCADLKYRQIGSAYLAATGWTLYSNILEDYLRRRRSQPRLSDEARIFAFFNELWHALHEDYSFVKDQAGEHENGDGGSPFGSLDSSFLVAAPGGLYCVSPDLSVTRYERYFAIGSGATVALGACHALWETEPDAEAVARRAAEAAIAHDVYCGPPINLVAMAERRTRADRPGAAPTRRRMKRAPRGS